MKNFFSSLAMQGFHGGSGGASSWNDLTDKPFDSEMRNFFSWDGNTDGLEMAEIGGQPFYKITGELFTMEELSGALCSLPSLDAMEIPIEGVAHEEAPGLIVFGSGFVVITNTTEIGVPSTGVWAAVPVTVNKKTVTKLDIIYLPATTICVTIDENMNSDISLDDIKHYINNGFNVIARYYQSNSYTYVPFSNLYPNGVVFSGYTTDNDEMKPIRIDINKYNTTITKGATGGGVFFTYGLFLRRPSDNKYFEIEIDDNGNLKATATNFAPEKLISE